MTFNICFFKSLHLVIYTDYFRRSLTNSSQILTGTGIGRARQASKLFWIVNQTSLVTVELLVWLMDSLANGLTVWPLDDHILYWPGENRNRESTVNKACW